MVIETFHEYLADGEPVPNIAADSMLEEMSATAAECC